MKIPVAMSNARTPKACLSCRKMKQKCNAFERYPEPCTRCQKKKIECVLDGVMAQIPTRTQWSDTVNAGGGDSKLPRIFDSASPISGNGVQTGSGVPPSFSSVATVRAGTPGNPIPASGTIVAGHHQVASQPLDANAHGSAANAIPPSSVSSILGSRGISSSVPPSQAVGMGSPSPLQPHQQRTTSSSVGHTPTLMAHSLGPASMLATSPSTPSPRAGQSSTTTSAMPFTQPMPTVPPFPLEDVTTMFGTPVPKERLLRLYATYFSHHHQVFPIIPIDLITSDNPSLFDQHRMLFWAICLVATPVADPDLSVLLLAYVRGILHSRGPYHSFQRQYETVALIYALVIMSYWPLGTQSLQEEVGWLFNSLAHHLALQADLHHAYHFADLHHQMNECHRIARAKAWVSVVITNIHLSVGEGVPSTVTASGFSVEKFFRNNPDFAEVTKQYRIMRLTARAVASLGNDPESELGLSFPETRGIVYKNFVEAFSQLSMDVSPMSPWTELILLASRLYLHGFMLLPDTLERDVRSVIVPIYSESFRIASILTELKKCGQNLLITPQFITRAVLAAFTGLHKIMSSPHRSLLEEARVLELGDQLLAHLQSITVNNKNGMHWTVGMAKGIRNMYILGKLSPVLCSVRSRMSAGVLVSCGLELLQWRSTHGKTGIVDGHEQRSLSIPNAEHFQQHHQHAQPQPQPQSQSQSQSQSQHEQQDHHTQSQQPREQASDGPHPLSQELPLEAVDYSFDMDGGFVSQWGLWEASPWGIAENFYGSLQ